MHTGRDAMHARPPLVDRHHHDVGHHRLERLVHRHAPRLPLRQLALAVAGLVDGELQRLAMAGVLLAGEAREAIGHRILPGGMRDFIHQRFHHEGGMGVAHRAPPQHRHVHIRVVHRQLHRETVVVPDHALGHGGIHAILDHVGLEQRALRDRLPDDHVIPAQHLAAAVQADIDAVQVHRAVVAATDVVLAAPDHLDRAGVAGCRIRLGNVGRFHHVVRCRDRTPAEAAARHHRVQLDLLGRNAQRLGQCPLVDRLELRADPHLGAADIAVLALQVDRAVERLHRRVGKIRKFVVRLDALGGRLDGADIAGLGHHAGLVGELLVFAHQRGRRHARARVLPRHLQRVAAQLGRPVAVGHDRHARAAAIGRDRHDIDHALDGLGRGGVVFGHLTAEARRAGHHRHLHVGQARIDAEPERGVELAARIQPRRRLADDAEPRRALECDLLGHRQRHRGLRELTVGRAVAAGGDRAVGRTARGRIHLPALGRRRDQHRTCTRAKLAVLRKRMVERGRAAGDLDAVHRILVGIAGRREHRAHVAPIGVELFGQRHRQCGVHALAELQPVDGHRDGVVRRDDQERLRRRRRLSLRLLRARQCRGHADREAAAGQRRDFQEAATVERRDAGIGRSRRGRMLSATTRQRLEIADSHGLSPVGLTPAPWPHRGWRRGCAGTWRSGTGCRPWRGRCRHRSVPSCCAAGRRRSSSGRSGSSRTAPHRA